MKKKTIAVSVIISVFLIGIVSAGLIDYFGRITGSVEVSAPVFYATREDSSENPNNYLLSLNEFVGNFDYVQFTNGGTNKWFVTEELGIESFYESDYNFKVELCTENNSINEPFGQVVMDLKILKENGDFRETICELNINNIPTINHCLSENYQIYEISCSADELSGLDKEDRFAWIMTDGSHDITYYIKLDGDTKFEIDIK